MGRSGPFPCISSRTKHHVSQQCGLRHNRFIRQGTALAPASRLIYHPDTPWGYNWGYFQRFPQRP